MERDRCPICDRYGFKEIKRSLDVIEGWCRVCGPINISESAIHMVNGSGTNRKYLLSAYFRQQEPGLPVLKITPDNVERALKTVISLSTAEKLGKLLDICADRTSKKGQYSDFDWTCDYPLLAVMEDEIIFFIDELAARNFIVKGPSMPKVTFKGWEEVDLRRRARRESKQVFVAMSFDEKYEEVYSVAIKPAILQAGYDPIRVDKEEHANRIDDEIVAAIRTSRFMVADFSGQRCGVYFETGMMLGLGRRVIWMCEKNDLENIHFDARQFNFIDYKDLGEANSRLRYRIEALEGKGPGAWGANGHR